MVVVDIEFVPYSHGEQKARLCFVVENGIAILLIKRGIRV